MSSVATSENPAVGGMPDSPVPLPRGRRRTELAMLVFAVALVAFAYANVGFGLKGKLPPGMAEYLLGFIVLLAIATWRCGSWPRGPTRCCCRWPPR